MTCHNAPSISSNPSSGTLLSTRAKIIVILEKIQQGQSLATLLNDLLGSVSPQDKGFAHELLLGTLRQWWALSRIGEGLIEREVSDKGIWAGLTVQGLSMRFCEKYKKTLLNSTKKSPKTTVCPTGLPNSLSKIGVSIMMNWGKHYANLPRFFCESMPNLAPWLIMPNC